MQWSELVLLELHRLIRQLLDTQAVIGKPQKKNLHVPKMIEENLGDMLIEFLRENSSILTKE